MAKGLISHIIAALKSYPSKVYLVENNDRFLYRTDVVEAFAACGIEISNGTKVAQRIKYELRDQEGLLVLLSQDSSNYLEDIKQYAVVLELNISSYLSTYHIPSVIDLPLPVLDQLFRQRPLVKLNKKDTLEFVSRIKEEMSSSLAPPFEHEVFVEELTSLLAKNPINWSVVSRLIADGVLATIGKPSFTALYRHVNEANKLFQDTLESSYQQTKNSSAIKKPKIVSKILDHLSFNYREKKIALVVVDGMALWQYALLSDQLPGRKDEAVIYSWLPSITQLSRQAIFRGDIPKTDYRQGPRSEDKLWRSFWESKGCPPFGVDYQHGNINLDNLNVVRKLALVFKDLDEKMHSSTDYNDLLGLTRNWIERSEIVEVIETLLKKGFTVFLTTDHGNIQARGWRGLKGKEKLGTNKSGSRSERHIEYSEKWLSDEFMEENQEMQDDVSIDEQSIYFKTDLSFSNKDSLVTHGGAHLLEVLIPFITIHYEA